MRINKKVIIVLSGFIISLGVVFLNYIPADAFDYYVIISNENYGEVKQPIKMQDYISMGFDISGDFSNDRCSYTFKPLGVLRFDWDNSTISKEPGSYPYANSLSVYEGSMQHNTVYESYHSDTMVDSLSYEQIVLHSETDVIKIEIGYVIQDDNGNLNQYYAFSFYTIQKDPYNVSFKYKNYDGTILPGFDGTMYRMYNPNSGEHFYTANVNEGNYLMSVGWYYEDYAWMSPTTSDTPVYRLYNPNTGDHHYTVDFGEKNHLVSIGWNDEGIGWYSASGSGRMVYRLYNPNATGAGSHHYTTKSSERIQLVLNGWRYEGVGWYGL
ncbi:MAG: hypothetical protein K5644_07990 [Lachnospiraceae bacterium]|nr:hypothetical protein [Lachnospiraceae bacterium]